MAYNITGYFIHIEGGEQRNQTQFTMRARIQLNTTNAVAAYIVFKDPWMLFESDKVVNKVVWMYLPSSMFQSVVDILRNEKPFNVGFNEASGRAFLTTSSVEPVGEAES
ncbi:MAG TPA: hypothetical protein VK253_01065 [Candidatus Binatia bacterium]|nr:hypothetical protein [Candidatus Binatia bacterium]